MTEQPSKPPLASVEADLFGAVFAFHMKTTTLLRQSSLGDEKLNVAFFEAMKNPIDLIAIHLTVSDG